MNISLSFVTVLAAIALVACSKQENLPAPAPVPAQAAVPVPQHTELAAPLVPPPVSKVAETAALAEAADAAAAAKKAAAAMRN